MGYILVVHDNEEDLENIRMYLSFLGYMVEAACHGQEGCNLFDGSLECDLVITKVKMREINGNNIAQYIRNSQRPHTPIVAIASTGDNIDRNSFKSVLMTPLKLKVLGETVASFVPR